MTAGSITISIFPSLGSQAAKHHMVNVLRLLFKANTLRTTDTVSVWENIIIRQVSNIIMFWIAAFWEHYNGPTQLVTDLFLHLVAHFLSS